MAALISMYCSIIGVARAAGSAAAASSLRARLRAASMGGTLADGGGGFTAGWPRAVDVPPIDRTGRPWFNFEAPTLCGVCVMRIFRRVPCSAGLVAVECRFVRRRHGATTPRCGASLCRQHASARRLPGAAHPTDCCRRCTDRNDAQWHGTPDSGAPQRWVVARAGRVVRPGGLGAGLSGQSHLDRLLPDGLGFKPAVGGASRASRRRQATFIVSCSKSTTMTSARFDATSAK